MKFMVLLLALSGYVVTAKSSYDELPVHPGVGGLYKGPNSETIIKGPDGSVITAEAEGGTINVQPDIQPIVVEEPASLQSVTPVAEVVVAPEIASGATAVAEIAVAPVVASGATVVAADPVVVAPAVAAVTAAPLEHTIEIIQPDPHIIETEIVDAPLVEPQQSTDLVGPSGSISTRGSSSVVSGPASTTISEPAKVLIATPVVAAVPVIASVKTPLRAVPVVEIVQDTPAPVTSFILQPTASAAAAASSGISSLVTGSTLSPLAVSEGSTIAPGLLSSTVVNNLIEPQQHLASASASANIGQPAATIESASTFGVIENAGGAVQISTTARPELSISSTVTPLVSPLPQGNSQSSLNYALINNRQLGINPSLIPSANIIPPEIGPLPKGTIDLGTTVTVSSTPVPVAVSTPNIQRINDDVIGNNVVRSVDNSVTPTIPVQNHITGGVALRDNSPGIPPNGLIGSGLAKYGIDSSQINLAQVPLSSARRLAPNSPLPASLDEEIDDVSSTLWNRYGRDVNNDKDEKGEKGENDKSDEKKKN